jgi:hypothetical protein
MKADHVRRQFILLCRGVFFSALAFVSLTFGGSVYASKLTDFQHLGVAQTASTSKIGMTGNGINAIPGVGNATPYMPYGWTKAGNFGAAPQASGATLSMGASGEAFFPGVKYPFQAGYQVPVSTLFDAMLAVTQGPVGLAIFAAPFALEWLSHAGGRVDPVSHVIQRSDPNVCSTAPCYAWTPANSYYGTASSSSVAGVCSTMAPKMGLGSATVVVGSADNGNGTGMCQWYDPGYGYFTMGAAATKSSVAPSADAWLPSSMDDIAPYMKNINPDGRVVAEILDRGGDINMPASTVTGPASIDGPVSTTQNPDGTKSVSKTTHNFSNTGDTITNTSNITTVSVINVDNSVGPVTTTTVTPVASDVVPNEKKPNPCITSPDLIGCLKVDSPVADPLTKITKDVSVITPVTLASASGCPAPLSWSVSMMGRTYAASFSYSPMCDFMSSIATLMLAFGAFAAAWVLADSFKVSA